MYIYKITNTVNGKIYIGKTERKNPKSRFYKHLDGLKYGYHPNKHLLSAYKKYGESVFAFEVIETTTKSIIDDREKFFISSLKTYDPRFGYNKTMGGDGLKACPELSEKMKLINKGRKHTDESRRNMSIAHLNQKAWNKGKTYKIKNPRSAEYRKKLSLAITGKKITNPRKGFKLTEEHKHKMRLAKLGKASPHKGKKFPGRISKTSFKKGQASWSKGLKRGPASEETRKKLSIALKGRVFSDEHIRNLKLAAERRKLANEQSRNNAISVQTTETCTEKHF
jgi:group I intron endonuclease